MSTKDVPAEPLLESATKLKGKNVCKKMERLIIIMECVRSVGIIWKFCDL